jgi:hypothetical protein
MKIEFFDLVITKTRLHQVRKSVIGLGMCSIAKGLWKNLCIPCKGHLTKVN